MQALAIRLGRAVWRHVDLANTNASTQFAGSEQGRGQIAVGKEHKISSHVSAWLKFVVDEAYNALQATPSWLSYTERVDLQLNIHDAKLPDDMETLLTDASSQVVIRLTPNPEEHEIETEEPRNWPFIAGYEDGAALDAQDTETVIGILALMAEQSS